MKIINFTTFMKIMNENVGNMYPIGTILQRHENRNSIRVGYYEVVGHENDKYILYPLKSDLSGVKGKKEVYAVKDSRFITWTVYREPSDKLISSEFENTSNSKAIEWDGEKPLWMLTKDEYKSKYSKKLKEYINLCSEEYFSNEYKFERFTKSETKYEWKKDKMKDAPIELVKKRDELVREISNIIHPYKFKDLSMDDINSNKFIIKYALENGIYEEYIRSGKVNIKTLEPIFQSVKLNIPKKLIDINVEANNGITSDVVKSIQEEEASFKNHVKEFFIDVWNKYKEFSYGKNVSKVEKLLKYVKVDEPFNIYDIKNKIQMELFGELVKRRNVTVYDDYVNSLFIFDFKLLETKNGSIFTINPNYMELIEKQSILDADYLLDFFSGKLMINLPKYKNEYPRISGGKLYSNTQKGFESNISMKYSNGLEINVETETIYAGGYNIQVEHLRGLFKIFYNGKKIKKTDLEEILKNN